MTFQSYAQRIMSLREYDTNAKKIKTMIQKRFQVKNTEMKMVSFPYGHPKLNKVRK